MLLIREADAAAFPKFCLIQHLGCWRVFERPAWDVVRPFLLRYKSIVRYCLTLTLTGELEAPPLYEICCRFEASVD